MTPLWEMPIGMDIIGMGMEPSYTRSSAAVAPLITHATTTMPAYLYGSLPPAANGNSLRENDLIAFSDHDLLPSAATDTHFYATTGASSMAGSVPLLAQAFSNFQSQQSQFDLCMPQCEDAAELEWLSQFVEDSFSDVPYQPSTSMTAPSCEAPPRAEQLANGRGARSKRSRAAPGAIAGPNAAWSSLVAPPQPPDHNSPSSSSSSSELPPSRPTADKDNKNSRGKKGGWGGVGVEGVVRRCTHCASEKTPQWRTGPLGPKTLCNACGVRYKSGRLVPEYRPAASPTFVLTRHSNSHRKVMELRRQKELLLHRHQEIDSSDAAAAAARPEQQFDDYGIC
ncbi:unnamed protein product [Musa acuminata subsp. malaccensis]|uniref:(wild Malaysian banana) hypothetical protein n=1 Tax=Musa acuminata subsp. malaccensis TaxID=214687 RepID=A0A804IXZ2_MUSAM|nr:PREDICTED: GATA transcription factor 4-like [Musa acuminata subsp. malaccensis]CAG1844489.1 unnamed protein product [Musa acuminata subsp. malaccensis]